MPNLITLRNARIKKETPKGDKPKYIRQTITTGKKIAIKAMLDQGMSQWQVAHIEQVSRATVNRIANDPELDNLRSDIVEKTKSMLSSRFYVLADRSIDKAMEEDRIDKLNSYQLTMMGAVSVDKARLMDGMSTENVSVRGLNGHLLKDAKELDNVKDMIIKRFKTLGQTEEKQDLVIDSANLDGV